MYAIVDILGEQYKVEKDAQIVANQVNAEVGAKVEFENVLLVRTDSGTTVGTPFVEGAKVVASVVEHGKADKVLVFKKKRRKGFKVKRGHRQSQSVLKIEKIEA